MSLDECDRLIKRAAAMLGDAHAIVCLYTGVLPNFCEPMLRDPVPDSGWPLDALAVEFSKAKRINTTIEDGALILGREDAAAWYRARGWSFRLFPPPSLVTVVANRGSAFNSCLLMSKVQGVDGLYQLADGGAWRFRHGAAIRL